ncbi:MAG: hypothetical protein WBY94_12475 [Polyangiaceae bacterium]
MPCPRRTRIAWMGLALALTGALTAATSHAAPSDEVRRARALFAQAEADEDGERWGEALEKLQAVARVKLTAGVRYHIALCEEHLGHLVRALGDYGEAEDQARLENAQDVLRIVGNQVAALEPRVPRLTVRVAPAVSEVTLKLDGEPIGNPPIGAPMQVDPGVHSVVATAPDRPPTSAEVTLHEHESKVVELKLQDAPREPAPPLPSSVPPSPQRSSPRPLPSPSPDSERTARPSTGPAIVATALAVALASGGAAAFLIGGAEHDTAVRTCALIADPSPDACDWLKNRVRAWDFAAAGAWGGALIAATTALVFWTRPVAISPAVGVALVVAPAAVGLGGRF